MIIENAGLPTESGGPAVSCGGDSMADYLITGAGGGMGKALCRALTEEGHQVWGLDLLPTEEMREGETLLTADVTDGASLEEAFEQVRRQAGTIDGIIHTAGVYDLGSLAEMPEEDFRHIFDVNVFGVFRVNRTFLPLMKNDGRIVIVTSELAPLRALPFTGVYAVTKTALDRYAEALRMELQLLGHRVIVVRPGAVNTAMLGVSTARLESFCKETRLFRCNAERFRRIVDRIEAKNIPSETVAGVISRALRAARPKAVYSLNRNPLLLLFDVLPLRAQLWLIRRVLS